MKAEQVVLVATRLTAVNDAASERGMPVRLGWSPSAIVVLATNRSAALRRTALPKRSSFHHARKAARISRAWF
jgi:hypothetical protein